MNLSFFLHILGLEKQELPRVLQSFTLVFLGRLGFVLGWAVVIAMVLDLYGLSYLPIFFLVDAVLVLLTNYLFRFLDERYSTQVWMGLFIVASSFFIFIAASLLAHNTLIAMLLVMVAHGFFLSKFNMVFSVYLEENFTASESQRALPIVEAGEILASLLAGLGLAFLSHFLSPYKFLMIWVLALVLMIPVIFRSKKHLHLHQALAHEHHHKLKQEESFFMIALLGLFFLQWFGLNLLEYLYAFSVFQLSELSHQSFQTSFFLTKMGYIQAFVSALSLVLQIILSSRILRRFGVLESLGIQGVLSFFMAIPALLWSHFLSIFALKSTFDTSSILFKSAYDSALYGVPHTKRLSFRENMYGIMKPLGAIIASLWILIFSYFSQKYWGILLGAQLSFIAAVLFALWAKKNFHKNHERSNPSHLAEINFLELLAPKDFAREEARIQKLLDSPKISWSEWVLLMTLCAKHAHKNLIPVLISQLHKGEDYAERTLHFLQSFPLKELKKSPFTKELIFSRLQELLHSKHFPIAEKAFKNLYRLDSYALSRYFFENKEKSLGNLAFLFEDPSLALELKAHEKWDMMDLLKLSTVESQRPRLLECMQKESSLSPEWHHVCRALRLKELIPFLRAKKVKNSQAKEQAYTRLFLGDKEALPLYASFLHEESLAEPEFRIAFYQLEESIQESLWDIVDESSR